MALVGGNGHPIAISFFVPDVDGTALTGLVDSDFSKIIIANAAVSSVSSAITEIGFGYYALTFTPDTTGVWDVSVKTPTDDVLGNTVQVGEYQPHDALARVLKTAWNRLEVDLTAQELVLYDDDGNTVLQRWPLETDAGPPADLVVTQPGIQTRRRGPLL